MAVIDSIKQKLLQLDPGSFQSLCDTLLAKEGYPNIVSLGTESGTKKTTKGTPDTYFYAPDGKYVFVEYTTQQSGLIAKITDDIKKCLDVSSTGIPNGKISEIIYCHTSSNITPQKDSEIRKLCEDEGINLTIIGIDRIAEDLYLKHRSIAKELLGISIDTGQIQERSAFIRQYDANRLAAPLNTQFLFREQEISQIDEAFETENIVVLTGAAGTGKTRLALHYAQLHAEKYGELLFCICDNALPIYEDLSLYIDKPGQYFLFIDDANQLSGLRHVLKYATMKSLGYEIKILITVRDYAVPKVKTDIREISSFKELEIKAFSDDEIKKLLGELLDIRNEKYLNRIANIAEGNARIAVLAGMIAFDSDRLESIDDVSQLYESYYGIVLRDSGLSLNRHLIITAGVISFLRAIHLDHIDPLLTVLKAEGISRDTFIENIHVLHGKEILDIYNDKAVHFSEQCLANYMLKYVFFDMKLLNIADMIKACFNKYKERTIESISTLLGVFRNKDLHQYVGNQIKLLWSELAKENSPYFVEFVKAFYLINPTEALLILHEWIDSETKIDISPNNIDTNKGRNYQSVDDDKIKMLGGFKDSTDLSAALDLFFQYYLKRPDLFIQFYHASNMYFCIKSDSRKYNYYTQRLFFEKLREYSNQWKEEKISILFLEIANSYLELLFTPAEGGRKNVITIYSLPLTPSEGVDTYRKLIWDSLIELCRDEENLPKIRGILQSYGRRIDNVSIPIVKSDISYISKIFEVSFPPEQLVNCLLANHLNNIIKAIDIDSNALFDPYLNNDKMRINNLLKGPDYSPECEQIKQQQIADYISKCGLAQFKTLIDICSEIEDTDNHKWERTAGLNLAFKAFAENNHCFTEAVRYYLGVGTPLNVYPKIIINKLFETMPSEEVFNIIDEYKYQQKNLWLYVYYYEMPQHFITRAKIDELYSFLNDTSDKLITSSPYRDVDFLEKYNTDDENVFLNGCRIILKKSLYSPFVTNLYFGPLFYKKHNTPSSVIAMFKDDVALLEDIYITMITYDKHEDYNGEILRALYLATPSILPKFIRYIADSKESYILDDNYIKIQTFFLLENADEIYDNIIDELVMFNDIENLFEVLLVQKEDNNRLLHHQDRWIKHNICSFSHNALKMKYLFSTISKLTTDRKLEYIKLFMDYNMDFVSFQAIPLVPTFYIWSGSRIPLFTSWIEYLQQILPNCIGLRLVRHKKHIEDQINYLRMQIENEQIEEILRG